MEETICVESDVQKDTTRALDMLHTQLIAAVIDPYSWKWTLLILHHTLQTIMASTLEDAEQHMPRDRAIDHLRIRRSLRARDHEPERSGLPQLFEQLKSSLQLQASPEIERDIQRLSRYRDAFVQDLPTRWELDVQALPRIAQSCLRLVDLLGWTSSHTGGKPSHLSDDARGKLVASVNVLDALDRQYRT